MVTFTERTPVEAGFAPVFAAQIAPELDRLDKVRVQKQRQGARRVYVGIGIGVLLASVTLLMSSSTFGLALAFIFLAVGAIGGFAMRGELADDWAEMLTDLVMPPVCAHVGDVTYRVDGSLFPVRACRDLGVVGRYDDANMAHLMTGQHRGVAFKSVRANLTETSTDSDGDSTTSTVFSGMLFEIEVPEPAPTTILIARDFGRIVNRLAGLFQHKKRGMPRVDTGHARFEAAFELHADDPDALGNFLPDAFLTTLVDLSEREGGTNQSMTAAFQGRSFYLALRGKTDLFDFHGLGRPAHDIAEDLHDVFEDLTIPHRIIDRLAGD